MPVRDLAEPLSTITPEQELARVMWEIVEALHGKGAALTMHPDDRPPEIVHADTAPGVREGVAHLLATGRLDARGWPADEHAWVEGPFQHCAPHAITLPVRRVAGHSPLLITIFFDDLDAERRAAAELAYLQRRPFAVGYFRLWQLERLHRREVSALRAALDLVDIGVMLITKGGLLAFANRAARAMLAAGTGLKERHGRVRATAGADNVVLDVSLRHVLDASGDPAALKRAPLFTVDREGRPPLMVAAIPAPEPVVEAGEIAAMLFAVDPDLDITELATPVCRVFRLTPVETRLACELASGGTLAEAAAKLRVTETSVRAQLKSIFAKTGTNRQAALVRLILMSLVHVSDGRPYEPVYRPTGATA